MIKTTTIYRSSSVNYTHKRRNHYVVATAVQPARAPSDSICQIGYRSRLSDLFRRTPSMLLGRRRGSRQPATGHLGPSFRRS